ncbi:hypothetical protein BCR35DRAFT_355239 [Leucosporidium creatinivorum]|uniref:Uncharacterized protein n=1 Tax=Leucosporidium creatinivorum TaxID=106004 RepID=A0A1Y2DM42_9BASI|nr:hypothetical protein BCR35DRAFT_355239 [Leucosporidium creatinivorum]
MAAIVRLHQLKRARISTPTSPLSPEAFALAAPALVSPKLHLDVALKLHLDVALKLRPSVPTPSFPPLNPCNACLAIINSNERKLKRLLDQIIPRTKELDLIVVDEGQISRLSAAKIGPLLSPFIKNATFFTLQLNMRGVTVQNRPRFSFPL